MLYFRTSQILELFDEAPDDGANWGNAVSKLEDVKDSDSSDESGSPEPTFDIVVKELLDGSTKNQYGTLEQPVKKNVALNNKKSTKSSKITRLKVNKVD